MTIVPSNTTATWRFTIYLLLETDVDRVSLGMFFQLFKLALQLGNRLFEVELMLHSGGI